MAHSDCKTSKPSLAGLDQIWQPLEITPPRDGKLIVGPGVSVGYYPRCSGRHRDQQCGHTQILFLPSDTVCEVTWKTVSGRNEVHTVQGHDLWIIAEGVSYTAKWLNEEDVIILYLGKVWLSQFGPVMMEGVRFESVHRLCLIDPLICGLKAALQRDLKSGILTAGHIVALGHCLASRLIHVLTTPIKHPKKYQRKLSAVTMQRVTTFVELNLGGCIDFKQLAREARLSVSHFGVLFKATLGLTPEQYILHARLMKAKELITSGNHNVGEVAYKTGFADHSHLSVQFKRVFGAPPKTYLPLVRRV